MRRFVRDVLLFAGLVCGAMGVLVVSCFAWVDEYARDSIGFELNHKIAAIEDRPSPKVIIVGGSGCSHGINSPMLERELHMPVVNTGISGSLGLAYQLQAVSPYVRDGDWVVVIPEYVNFSECLGDGSLLQTVCDVRPGDRKLLDATQWLHLIQYMPRLGLKKIGHVIVRIFATDNRPKVDHCYGGWVYNENGDMISAWQDTRNVGFSTAGAKLGREIPADFGRECLSWINKFRREYAHCRLIMMPPAMQDAAFDRDIVYIRAVEKVLAQNETPFLASPYRYRMANSECWDSVYHMNGPGVVRRTQMLAADLAALLE